MLQKARDITLGNIGEKIFVFGVIKGVPLSFEKRLMYVHAASIYPKHRLWHERGIYAVLSCHLFDDNPVGDRVVCHSHGIGISQIYFVLGRGHFVVAVFHVYPDVFEHQHRIPS